MISKVCNFYWGGGPLSYLQYLSIVSFNRYNPDWTINLFMPKELESIAPTWVTNEQRDEYMGQDYLSEAKKLCNVIEIDFSEHEFAKPRHEVQKADIIRWHILYEYGGIWSDIDILYVKPMSLTGFDIAVCYHDDPYIGFFITKPHLKLFQDFYSISKDNIKRNIDDTYQALGADMLRHRYGSFQGIHSTYPQFSIVNLPMDIVYPYLPDNKDIEEMLFGKTDKTTEDTIGLHWYNGSPIAKKYQNGFDKYKENESVISKLVKDYV